MVDGSVRLGFEFFNEGVFGDKMLGMIDQGNGFGEFREEKCAHKGGVAAAVNCDGLVFEKGAVASGAVGKSVADKLLGIC